MSIFVSLPRTTVICQDDFVESFDGKLSVDEMLNNKISRSPFV